MTWRNDQDKCVLSLVADWSSASASIICGGHRKLHEQQLWPCPQQNCRRHSQIPRQQLEPGGTPVLMVRLKSPGPHWSWLLEHLGQLCHCVGSMVWQLHLNVNVSGLFVTLSMSPPPRGVSRQRLSGSELGRHRAFPHLLLPGLCSSSGPCHLWPQHCQKEPPTGTLAAVHAPRGKGEGLPTPTSHPPVQLLPPCLQRMLASPAWQGGPSVTWRQPSQCTSSHPSAGCCLTSRLLLCK